MVKTVVKPTLKVRSTNLSPAFLLREMTRAEASALLPEERSERRRLKNNEKSRRAHAMRLREGRPKKRYPNGISTEQLARLHERDKAYRKANPERLSARKKAQYSPSVAHKNNTAYYLANREAILEQKRNKHRQANPGYISQPKLTEAEREIRKKESAKRSYEANKDQLLLRARERWKANPAPFREKSRRFYAKHPDAGAVATSKRRARETGAVGSYTEKEWKQLLDQYDNRCGYCEKTPLIGKRLVHEHRTPLSRGGSNYISNIIPSCQKCNNRKFTLTEEEFRELLSKAARGEFVHWGRGSLQKNFPDSTSA